MNCYCCSSKPYSECCKPIHSGEKKAETAEALMRSRFSAYCLEDWSYILNTYAKAQQSMLSEEELRDSAAGSQWLHLDIIAAIQSGSNASSENKVEFKAFYAVDKKLYLMHETSDFVKENTLWRYTTGTMHDDSGLLKPGRNDSCICGSGRKFKQCCMKKL